MVCVCRWAGVDLKKCKKINIQDPGARPILKKWPKKSAPPPSRKSFYPKSPAVGGPIFGASKS